MLDVLNAYRGDLWAFGWFLIVSGMFIGIWFTVINQVYVINKDPRGAQRSGCVVMTVAAPLLLAGCGVLFFRWVLK
jgi:hypothetical protein